jgi:hypothetical protein
MPLAPVAAASGKSVSPDFSAYRVEPDRLKDARLDSVAWKCPLWLRCDADITHG